MSHDDDYLPAPRTPTEPSDVELRTAARVVMLRRTVMVLSGAAVLLLVVGMAYVVLTIRTTQVDSVARAKNTNTAARSASEASDRIENCTTPGLSCYERGQGQLTSIVVDVNRVTVLAAACASGTQERSVQAIQACVVGRLGGAAGIIPRTSSPSATREPTSKPSGSAAAAPRATASPAPKASSGQPSSSGTTTSKPPAAATPPPSSPSATPQTSLACAQLPVLDACLHLP